MPEVVLIDEFDGSILQPYEVWAGSRVVRSEYDATTRDLKLTLARYCGVDQGVRLGFQSPTATGVRY